MATDISKVNNVVEITQTGKSKRSYANCPVEYIIINSGATLSLKIGADTHDLVMSTLTIGGVAPADTADAYTKLSVVFPNPGGGGTGSTTAVADQETISGDGSEATPFAVINPLIDTDEQKWNDSFALAAGGTSRIVSGAAPWDSGLVFNVIGTVYPELVYYILGTRYTATPTQKTLAAADATNPRIDLIYFDTSGAVGVLTGTPAPNPAKPTVDSNTQVELTSITIPANATEPDLTDNLTVYNENTEFAVASTNGTLNAAATANPAIGTKHISIGSFTNNQNITFTDTGLHDVSQFQYFTFRIRLGATFTTTTFLSVRFANGASAVSNDVNIATGTFGWIRTVVGSYQFISIPIDRFIFTNSQFNRIYFILHGSNATGFAIDNVVLQGGITIPSPNILSNALADDKMFVGRSGIATAVYGSNNVANVLDYGADATGATDSTAAFNLAKAAKKRVYAPTGTYLISSVYLTAGVATNHKGIEYINGTELFGDGIGKTIIKLSNNASATTANSFFYPIINGHGVSNTITHDLEIDGNKANQGNYLTNPNTNPTGYYADPNNRWSTPGIMFKDGDNNQVYNVYVHDSQNNGIYYYNCTRCIVRNSKLSANGEAGVTYHVDCDGIIDNVLSTANNSDQIRVDYCDAGKVVIIKNSEASFSGSDAGATNWFAGIYWEASTNIIINKCYVHDNSAYGLDNGGDNTTGANFKILNCQIEYNGNAGIVCPGNGLIDGNTFYNNAQKRNAAHDTVSNYNQAAIAVHSATNLTIINNSAKDDRGTVVQTYFIKNWGGGGSTGFNKSKVLNNIINGVADNAHAYDGDDGTTNTILNNDVFNSAGTLINPATNAFVWTLSAGVGKWLTVPLAGSPALAATQIGFGDGSNVLTSSANLIYASNKVTIDNPGIAASTTNSLLLTNSTAATVGTTAQWAPSLIFSGSAWKSAATAAAQTDQWKIENRPVTGSSATTSSLAFSASINSISSFADIMFINSGGVVSLGSSNTDTTAINAFRSPFAGFGGAAAVNTTSVVINKSGAASSTAFRYGVLCNVALSNTAANEAAAISTRASSMGVTNPNASGQFYGVEGYLQVGGASNTTAPAMAGGIHCNFEFGESGTSPTIPKAASLDAEFTIAAAATKTITLGYGVWAHLSGSIAGGAVITTYVGVKVDAMPASFATNNYGIWQEGTAAKNRIEGKLTVGAASDPTAFLTVAASTTAAASLNIPSGTAPTSPTSGDFWYDGTNLKFRDGGTTRTITWT